MKRLTTGHGAEKKGTVERSALNRTVTSALRDSGDLTEGLLGRREELEDGGEC